jgi:hypothetical protein
LLPSAQILRFQLSPLAKTFDLTAILASRLRFARLSQSSTGAAAFLEPRGHSPQRAVGGHDPYGSVDGRGWIGWTPRGAYLTADIRILSLVPGWLFLLLAGGLATLAWLREGRS